MSRVHISAVVEGPVDGAVVKRLIQYVDAAPATIHGNRGKDAIRIGIDGYNNAAKLSPWLVLVDLDHDAACAPDLRRVWLPEPAPRMCFRVAVRAVEAWLLADQERLAPFLSVSAGKLPKAPETLEDPKASLVHLAGQSRKAAVRQDMIPRPGSGRAVGPAYTSRIVEFISDQQSGWRPSVAAQYCDSLRRTIACLEKLRRWEGRV